jgi:hypothetical protein
MSWALIVCPLLRPALSSAYCKVAGNNLPNAGIFVNAEVKRDFSWFSDAFRSFSGIRILRSLAWGLGLGFWSPSSLLEFAHALPPAASGSANDTIFWFEALCVASAIEYAAFLRAVPRRLANYTDSLDIVQMLNSLKASGS